MDNNGVDPAGDEPSVAEVGVEVEALGNSSSWDSCGRGGKGPLIEEISPSAISSIVRGSTAVPRVYVGGACEAALIARESKESIAYEGIGVWTFTVSKAESNEVEGNS